MAPLYPPGLGYRDSWAGLSPPPALRPRINPSRFFFQILGGVILGFGVWILADRSSFISVLRKDPCFPRPAGPGGEGQAQAGLALKDSSSRAAGHFPC